MILLRSVTLLLTVLISLSLLRSVIFLLTVLMLLSRPCTEVQLFQAFSANPCFNFCFWAKGQLRDEGIKSLLSNCQ